MKKLYALCYGVILLCIVGTAILLIFTPDTIPVHYNFAGEVDRFGSKYENLICPIFTIIMGAFFILLAKQQRKKGETVNEKILLYTGICTLLFFAALGFYFMLKAIRYDPDAAATVSIDAMKFTGIAIGILLVILGNIMPKMRRNAMFGLRTKWSISLFGGFMESIVPELKTMTEDEGKDFLYHIAKSMEAQEYLKKRAEGVEAG